jgi:8-oxo-dGTP pyrophosphatase MutT (NUDIX family)
MEKHFTVTGFVVHGERTLLLWHRLLKMWVPPGGHIEPNEDPQEAVLREIREETGLDARPIASEERLDVSYPRELAAPVTILVEDSPEPAPPHQHVDLIYFCTVIGEPPELPQDESHLTWVDEAQLRRNEPLSAGDGISVAVPEDVRLLALRAIERDRQSGG